MSFPTLELRSEERGERDEERGVEADLNSFFLLLSPSVNIMPPHVKRRERERESIVSGDSGKKKISKGGRRKKKAFQSSLLLLSPLSLLRSHPLDGGTSHSDFSSGCFAFLI